MFKRKWLLVVVGVMMLFTACVGGIAYFFVSASQEAEDIEALLSVFVEHIATSETELAYDFLASQAKREQSFDEFKETMDALPSKDFVQLATTGWLKNMGSDGTYFEYSGTDNVSQRQ
jgi:hypothetical protein